MAAETPALFGYLQKLRGKLFSIAERKEFLIGFAEFFEARGELFACVGLLNFFDFRSGQSVAALIFRVTGVPFEPLPLDEVRLARGIEIAPEVGIFYGLTVGGHPPAHAPGVNPLGDALAQVLRVGEDNDLAGFFEGAQGENGGAQFHAVVGGGGLASRDGALVRAIAQNRRPTAWAGVSEASAIGENSDFLQGFFHGKAGELTRLAWTCAGFEGLGKAIPQGAAGGRRRAGDYLVSSKNGSRRPRSGADRKRAPRH